MILSMLVLGLLATSCGTTTTTTAGTTDNTVTTDNTGTASVATTTDTGTTVTTTTTTAHAAHADVPATITTTFSTRYPNATAVTWQTYDKVTIPIDWEMTGWPTLNTGDYVVQFEQDGHPYYAWYDADGTWIGSSALLADHSNLPAPVRDLLVQKYNGYTIEKVEQEWDKEGNKYEIKLKKTDDDKVKLHVTDQGVVLKEKKKD